MTQVLLIAVFASLFLSEDPGAPWFAAPGRGLLAAGVCTAMAGIWLATHASILWQARRLDRLGEVSAVARADLSAAAGRLAATLTHIAAVFGFGWLAAVRSVCGDLVLFDEVLAAAPALLVFVGTWWSMYTIDQRLRDALILRDLDGGRPVRPGPTRRMYVVSALRHQAALAVVPVLAIGAWNELVERSAGRWPFPAWLPVAVVQILGMGLVLTVIPAVLRRVWDTVRLGPGPLRSVLESMCSAHRVRVRELLVWRTHGTMINGAVMGLFWPVRYILLTDALLDGLTGPQVEAVMAHELGHIRRHHMLWLGVAALAAMGLSGMALDSALAQTGWGWVPGDWGQGVVAVGAVAVGLLVFGYFSRRFEWQADAFAVQHLSGYLPGRAGAGAVITPYAVDAMVSALRAVAELNHIPPGRFTWRHGSISTRLRRLRALVGLPASRLTIDRQASALKLIALAGMGLLITATVYTEIRAARTPHATWRIPITSTPPVSTFEDRP
jgi:Zn-dependent protease with chaperone function